MKLTADTDRIASDIQKLRELAETMQVHKAALISADSMLRESWSGLSADGCSAAGESLETNLEKWIQGMGERDRAYGRISEFANRRGDWRSRSDPDGHQREQCERAGKITG